MNVIEYNGHLLLIDCGVLFPEEEQPGVDLILPDFSYIKNRLDKVDALVLTHGHEDHIGGVPYLLKLRPDIPLIGSKLTLAFVDAKCKEHRQNPTKVEVSGRDKLKVGPFDLEFVNVTHSIPDALAVYVKTPAGSLIDTGDIKLDQLPLDHRITDLVEFGKIGEKGVDLLMMDSTNAEVPGFVKPETSIGPALDQAFAQATRKIIVASFSSHVHRVQQVVDAAHKYGRKVVFVGRSMVRGKAAVVGSVPCGYVYVDGDSVGELTDDELEKRRILGTEGFVSAFVVVDTDNHEVVTGPKIYLNAVAEDESEFDKVRHQIAEQLNDAMMQGTRDTYKLQQIMRRTLGGWVARQLHRKPMIVPVVADIAQDVEIVDNN